MTGLDVAALLLVGAVAAGIGAHAFYRRHVALPLRIAEEVRLIAGANPAHRVDLRGLPAGLRAIALGANEIAARLADAQRHLGEAVERATLGINEEKNRLAALMSELVECVLVCNSDGRILLYNAAAVALIDTPHADTASPTTRVGLGRPVFPIVDRERIGHARARIAERLAAGDRHPVARFVCIAPDGRLLRAQMAPVMDAESQAQSGYVLLLEDATRAMEGAARGGALLRSLTEGTRAGLASLRAAAEALDAYPDMDSQTQRRFIAIVNDEAERLSAHLESIARQNAEDRFGGGTEEILGADLLHLAAQRIEAAIGLEVRVQPGDSPPWLNVDSYLLVAALTVVARHARDALGVRALALELAPAGRFAQLDVCWQAARVPAETVRAWESEVLPNSGGSSVRGLIEGQGGDAWYMKEEPGQRPARYRILVPAATGARAATIHPGRPEFYDFDLFHQARQTPELDQRRLDALAYTVFDTETTGLEPARGDEIIAIGAVRIVNGRVLSHENFQQLLDPGRAVNEASLAIHGLDDRALQGQPRAETVLPRFRDFCEDTVLVAHNAAFDMRFLQMKENSTGARFDHPVLDTLLLSAVAHPQAEDHSLEAIAARLGVEVVGRHTALGDATLTAQIFLRLLPLLAAAGIATLGEARAAAQRTYYARLEY